MKALTRVFVFSYIALYIVQQFLGCFRFGDGAPSYLLVVLALAVLNLFSIPVLKLVSLPFKGLGYLVVNFIIVLITMYVLTICVPSFSIEETTTPVLMFFGFLLPSQHITKVGALVYSALLFSIVYSFFGWLCPKKR